MQKQVTGMLRVCPKCGSSNVMQLADGSFRCLNCGFKGRPITPKLRWEK